MKILLLLKEDIQVNRKTSVLKEVPTDLESVDKTYELNPKFLKKAVLELQKNSDVTEIITCGSSDTERKFRTTYADTIAYFEKQLNKDKEGLPEKEKVQGKHFDISEKDKELLKKKDVSKLEIAFAKFKPKAKTALSYAKNYWKYLKGKTYNKKKIPVYLDMDYFCFSTEKIDFFAFVNVSDEFILKGEKFLAEKKLQQQYIVKNYDSGINKFIKNHIPLKVDNKNEVVRKTIQNVAVVAFVVAGVFLLYNNVYKSVENTAIQSEIQSIYYDGDTTKKVSEKEKVRNFKKLQKINSEIVAWISVPHTNIDYPVLYHKEDTLHSQYYLYNNYEKNYSQYGSIFIDFRSQQGVKSKNVIMHGHHMMDGSMFANLLKYGKTSIDMNFYKKSPTFTVTTPDDGDEVYKIISVYKTTGDKNEKDFFNYLQGDFTSDAEFMNYVYNIKARSLIDTNVDINENDTLVTLSTCSYEVHENYRTVVVGRKVRKGESEKVNVSSAVKNKNPYFPSSYYYRFGGTQPKLTSFRTELKKGNIDWYDGKGNLRGNQKLTGGKYVIDRTSTTTKKPSSSTKKTSSTSTTKPTTKTSTTKATKPSTTRPRKVYYTVKFVNANGRTIKLQRVEKGHSASAPKAPSKASTKHYRYKFVRWSSRFNRVNSNLVIKPIYTKVRIPQHKPKPIKPKPTKPKPKPTTVPKTTVPITTHTTEPATEEIEEDW